MDLPALGLKGDGTGHYRVMIWGSPGAGKSTLARRLAAALDSHHFDIDTYLWNDDWVQTPREELKRILEQAAAEESWVSDGVYLGVKEAFYPRATDVIWLDYPLPLILYRLVHRTWSRWWTGATLFGTNCRERWQETLFSRDSILWYCISNQRRVQRELGKAVEEMKLPLRRRFRWPSFTEDWMRGVEEARRSM